MALAALKRAFAAAGIAGTEQVGSARTAGFETLEAILAAVEHGGPNVTVIVSERFGVARRSRGSRLRRR